MLKKLLNELDGSTSKEKLTKLVPKPIDGVSLKAVTTAIRKKGSAKGFEMLRDIILEDAKIRNSIGIGNAIALAIQCDKHAMFADVSATKQKDNFKVEAWEKFLSYLNGASPTFVGPSGPEETDQDGTSEDLDVLGDETPGEIGTDDGQPLGGEPK
jgi:hypothetical protein